ncbi:MAG: acyltransferase [Rudaea sp.]
MATANNAQKKNDAGLFRQLKYGAFLVFEKLTHWCIHPHLRASCLRFAGASIGKNVRIYECSFFNLQQGFRHLQIANDVHVGYGCLFDLADVISIGERSTISPGVMLLTHSDPGAAHGSKLATLYPPKMEQLVIGTDCWIGANAVLLCGVRISDSAVVGAGSVVTKSVVEGTVVAGVPATIKRSHLAD